MDLKIIISGDLRYETRDLYYDRFSGAAVT